jgi:hypothetical protein
MERRRSRSARLHARHHALVVSALAVSLLTQALWVPAHAESTSVPSVTQPLSGPQATLDRFARAYRERSPEGVIGTYTADYRFHSFDDSLLKYTFGASREEEENSVRNMMLGFFKDGQMVRPPVDSIGMTMDGFDEGADPEHPDSTAHYRTIAIGRFEFGLRNGDTRMWATTSLHVFHLVRGDVAVLVPGQVADADHWYIRRWLENVHGMRDLLGKQDGDCGEPAPPAVGPRSTQALATGGVLLVRPLTNPACANLRISCTLPGAESAHVEVLDVSGRLVNRRPVPVATAGEVTVDAGKGAKILPGVYWVRLSQAARKPSTRMVVVAR